VGHGSVQINSWVKRFTPEFVKRWNRFSVPVGRSWRVDETYVKIRGKWVYLYRAVDRTGKTVDFRLSSKRDFAAAKAFFAKAIKTQGCAPNAITLDGYAASHRAVRELSTEGLPPKDTTLRSSKYLNNLIEQDHPPACVESQRVSMPHCPFLLSPNIDVTDFAKCFSYYRLYS